MNNRAPPAGWAFLLDNCGRNTGQLYDIAAEARRVQAVEDRKQRLGNKWKDSARQVRAAKAWRWYTDWQIAHGHL
jgi:hypothetical protein